jgi:hypothetical protein
VLAACYSGLRRDNLVTEINRIDLASMHNSRSRNMTLKSFIATIAILLAAASAALAQGMGGTSAAKKPSPPPVQDHPAIHHHIPIQWHKHHYKPAVQSSNSATSSGSQH